MDCKNVSSFTDKHGHERWRYRRSGKSVYLPGQPGDPGFDKAYLKATNAELPAAKVVKLRVVKPRSFADAWQRYKDTSSAWHEMTPESRARQETIAEDFLHEQIDEASTLKWGDVEVVYFKRRHIKTLLAKGSATPHATRHKLTVIRKMIEAALDEEWIDFDPTYKLRYRPKTKGWRAWTDAEMEAFEKRWPIGTTARLCYALALWLGNRRGDVTRVKPSDIIDTSATVTQGKTNRTLVLTVTPMLQEVLDAIPDFDKRPAVLMTAYGNPFSPKSLTGKMAEWTKAAGLAPGCTIHGLRKTLGKMLAESGATTRQIMDTLGHTDIAHAELYTRDAEQKVLARDAMNTIMRKGRKS